MARSSSGGLMAFAWTAVIFGAAFVICLILAILFYNQREDAVQKRVIAERQTATYIDDQTASDAVLQSIVTADDNAGKTVVRALLDQISDLKSDLSRAEASVVETNVLVKKLQSEVPGYKETIQQRQVERDQQTQLREAAEARVGELRTEMEGKLASLERERQAVYALVQAQGGEIDEQLKNIRTEFDQQQAQLQQTIEQKDDRLAQAQTRIRELESRLTIDQPEVLAKADARVTQVGQDRVRLDIGRNSGLQLGMNLELFAPDNLVRVQEDKLGRGKATIEVIGLEDNISTARIVRREPRMQIQPGDEALNIVFDPTRRREFLAYGEFDSNADGLYGDSDGEQWIESLVQRYGGEVGDELAVSTDFLIMGKQPALPEAPQGGFIDPEEQRKYEEELEAYNRYQAMIAKAQSYGVPMLNQNRFLELIGYYDRNAPLLVPGVPKRRDNQTPVPLNFGTSPQASR